MIQIKDGQAQLTGDSQQLMAEASVIVYDLVKALKNLPSEHSEKMVQRFRLTVAAALSGDENELKATMKETIWATFEEQGNEYSAYCTEKP